MTADEKYLTKLKELVELTLTAWRHQQSVSIQRCLLLYWLSLILAVFASILLNLNIAGVFSSSDRGLIQVLSVE